MTVDEAAAALRAERQAAADPVFAAGVRNFFSEPVDPWGVRSAALRPIEQHAYRIVKAWPKAQRNTLCDRLWHGRLEEGVLVCHLYRRFARECAGCEFKLFERWIDRYVHNWAHCDGISSWLVAASIENEPSLKSKLPPWTASPNRWKRRASAVALLQEAKKGRATAEILDIAGRLGGDPDDLVQKGLGWLLKETYPKQPEAVLEFLKRRTLPRSVVRYACEKMTAEHRKAGHLIM